MTDTRVAPVYVLIDYAYEALAKDNPDWNRSNYENLIPIVPLNEEPELTEFSGPRAIYEYTMSQRGTTPYRGQGSVSFAVHDSNFRRLTRSLNVLDNYLGRMDESARDVNAFVDWLKTERNVDFDVSFGNIRLSFIESGTPETEEGGPMIGLINVTFDYFVEYPDPTFPWSSA